MNKQITIIATIMLAMPLVFAMIAGTNKTIEFTGPVSECYILNNQSDLIGLELIEDGNNVIISTDIDYAPDNFSVSCLVQGQRQESSGGGSSGGGSTPSGWSAKCGYNKDCLSGKVNETIEDKTEVIQEQITEEITESIIQEEKNKEIPKGSIALVILIVIISIGLVWFLLYKIFKKEETNFDNYEKEVNENE